MTSKLAKFTSKLISKSIWILSIILIFLVLLLSILKLSLPYFLKQKETITEYIENHLGGDFDYESLQVDWTKFHPVITIRGLEWQAQSKDYVINSGLNNIEVNLWDTLVKGDLVTNQIDLDDIQIRLMDVEHKQNIDAPIDFETIKIRLADSINGLEHQYISAKNITIVFENKDKSYASQKIPELIYKQQKQKKQLVLDTNGELVSSGRLVVELDGKVLSEKSSIDYYLDFNQLNLELIANKLNIKNISDYQQVNIKTWAKQYGETIHSARMEMNNKNSLANLDVILNLNRRDDRYQLISERFDIDIKDGETYKSYSSFLNLRNSRVNSVELNEQQVGSYRYEIQTGIVPIGFISKSLMPFLNTETVSYLANLNPSGLIKQLNLSVIETDMGLQASDGFFELSNVSIQAYKDIPGLTINKLSSVGAGGDWIVKATVNDQKLDWRPMYKAPISVQNLEVGAQYKSTLPSVLQVNKIKFKNKDAKVTAKASLDFSDKFEMTIYAEAEDVNVGNLHYYWPRNSAMSPRTLEYLDESLLAGTVPFAKLIWQGSIDAFPFKDHSGQFNIQANVVDAVLKFQPDWPEAKRLNASASFENEKMTIKATQGELLGTQVSSAFAVLPDLKAPDEELFIDINAVSSYGSYKAIYNQSPLKQILGEDLIDIAFTDSVSLKLDLDLLLAKETQIDVNGVVEFNGNNISGIPYDIQLTNAQGQLEFSDRGAASQNLKANLFGKQLDINLKVDEYTNTDSLVQIDAKGQLNIGRAAKQFLGFSPLETSGASEFNLHYKIDEEENANESLIIRSNLLGSEIKGPKWIAKESNDTSNFLMTLFKVGEDLNVRTTYRDQLSAQLNFNIQNKVPKGVIKIGEMATQDVVLPKEGVAIEGYFDKIVVGEWLDAFKFEGNAEASWPDWIERINLTTPYLEFAGQAFTKVRINDVKQNQSTETLRLNLFSEQARANVAYLKDGLKKITIENLDLKLGDSKEQVVNEQINVGLDNYANWLLECQRCKINDYEFGPLNLKTSYTDNKINIEGEGFVSNQLSAIINGDITETSTSITTQLEIPNPDGLLKFWELSGDVRDTKTSAELSLNWPGRLHDFSLDKTSGFFKLNAAEGSIKDISDSQARIFSLFSLQSIPRRLSLDFSDLFGEGFYYDSITGYFNIKNGVLTGEKVEIKGTAADVTVSGDVDLNSSKLDQTVIVIPKLGSSLPVLAGWAIEPTTGLIMLIMGKIFEPAIDVVTSIEYKVTGTIDAPQVTEVSKQSKEVKVSEEQIEQQKKILEPESMEDEPKDSGKEPI